MRMRRRRVGGRSGDAHCWCRSGFSGPTLLSPAFLSKRLPCGHIQFDVSSYHFHVLIRARKGATLDGADNTAERLTSHPYRESDMGTTDSLQALNRLERTIKEQRALLFQAHGVLTCLYEVLLHGDGAEVLSYAQAAYVAR